MTTTSISASPRRRPERPGEWRTVIAGSDEVYLRGITAFRDHLAITERVNGLDQIRLRAYDGGERRIPFAEASYTVGARQQSRICAGRLPPRLQLDGHPADRLRLSPRREPARDDEGPAHPVGLRSEPLCDRAADGAGARRAADPGLDRLSPRLRAQRPRAGSSSTPMAPMAMRRRPASAPTDSACSTAAMPSPSPISAAATSSAINGIWTASSTGGPTRSTISSTPRAA